MITIETDIVIKASPDKVWAALVDFEGYADWNPYLVRVQGQAIDGETLTVDAQSSTDGPVMSQPVLLVALDPTKSMRWEGGLPDRALFKGDHWWTLDPIGHDTTKLRQYEDFTGALAEQIIGEHGERIHTNFVRFNEALKAHLEGQTS